MTSVAPQLAGAVGSRSGLESQRPPISSGEMVRTIMDRMAHALRDGFSVQSVDFFQLCIWFSKAVDNAVANNDIPYRVSDLAQLVKKVYDRKHDTCLRPAIMVLMFAVKNACRNKWFIKSDTDELLALSTEISSHFCKGENLIIDTNNIFSIMSKVITRFYPQFRMGHLIISVEAKVGFSVLATDFYVLQNLLTSPRERIRLFVSQVDNLESSSCITSPPQVNFLINGIGVEKRTSVSMESGAQLPTDVTWMVKVGINLLQAIGNFSSNYVIAIVVMTTVPSVDAVPLTDYVQPAVSEIPSDDELIEGPSRISLNCPISFQRIRNPVKGQRCKHLQCFDYENFMEINLRKPSWRCPHCNQSVDCTDLRIDQNMLKVLREVGNDVSAVLISPDWSWKPYTENSDVDQLHSHSSHGTGEHLVHSGSQKCECLVDLTAEVEGSDEAVHIRMGRESSRQNTTQYTHVSNYGTIDMKPSEEALEGLFRAPCLSGTPYLHTSATTQSNDYQSLRDALARPIPPNYPHGSAVSAVTIPEVPHSALSYPSNTMIPTDVDPVTTGPSRESVDTQTIYQPEQRSMQPGGHIVAAQDSIQMQGSWAATPTAIIESRRLAIPRDVIRVPSAVQALPAPSQMQTALARGKRNAGYTNAPVSSQSLPFPTANPDGLIVVNAERQQLRQQTSLAFPELALTMPMQLNPQERHPPPNQPVVGLAALSSSGLRNSLDQQMGLRMTQSSTLQDIRNVRPRSGPSTRVPHTSRQLENVVQPIFFHSFPAQQPLQPSSNLTATVQPPLVPGATTNQILSNPRTIGNSWVVADQILNIPVSPVLPEAPMMEMAPNQNWRPARMRGSIDISNLNLPGAHTPSMVSQILAQQHAQQAQARPSMVPSTWSAGSAFTPGNTFTGPMSRTQPWAGNAAHR